MHVHAALHAGGVALGVLAGAATGAVFVWGLETGSYNVWGAMVVIPIVVLADLLVLSAVLRREADTWIRRVIMVGFLAKLVGIFGRYFVTYVIYGGTSDAERYNRYAAFKYLRWRAGDLDLDSIPFEGTQWMEMTTTAVYTVIGPSPLAGFFVFGSAAFWGIYLCYRAFRTAFPEGDGRRYALLVFLLPSLIYWPSSIGKESWLMLFVGVTALGVARFFAGRKDAVPLLVAGAFGTAIVRPHIALMLFGALTVAQLFRPSAGHATSVLSKIAGFSVLAVGAVLLASQSAEFLGIDDLSVDSINEQLEVRGENATQGGSAFNATPALSPLAWPVALVTVLFRPFPFEANNAQLLVQSMEGVALMVLFYRQRAQLRQLPRTLRRNPYLVFVVSYVLIFCWGFSSIGNFGILARQRVLMLPLLVVLLALPLERRETTRSFRRRLHVPAE